MSEKQTDAEILAEKEYVITSTKERLRILDIVLGEVGLSPLVDNTEYHRVAGIIKKWLQAHYEYYDQED